MRLVAAYCASGPYRHLRRELEERQIEWFPWGYSLAAGASDQLRVVPGELLEIWEVDDSRAPLQARPMVVAEIDYVRAFPGYLALTLKPTHRSMQLNSAEVLNHVKDGKLLWRDGTVSQRGGRSYGSGRQKTSQATPNGTKLQPPFSSVPVGH